MMSLRDMAVRSLLESLNELAVRREPVAPRESDAPAPRIGDVWVTEMPSGACMPALVVEEANEKGFLVLPLHLCVEAATSEDLVLLDDDGPDGRSVAVCAWLPVRCLLDALRRRAGRVSDAGLHVARRLSSAPPSLPRVVDHDEEFGAELLVWRWDIPGEETPLIYRTGSRVLDEYDDRHEIRDMLLSMATLRRRLRASVAPPGPRVRPPRRTATPGLPAGVVAFHQLDIDVVGRAPPRDVAPEVRVNPALEVHWEDHDVLGWLTVQGGGGHKLRLRTRHSVTGKPVGGAAYLVEARAKDKLDWHEVTRGTIPAGGRISLDLGELPAGGMVRLSVGDKNPVSTEEQVPRKR